MNYCNVPCLGQSFHLGMVYDCYEEKPVFGLYLWNEDDVDNATITRPNGSTRTEVYATHTMSERIKALGAEGSLKISLLAGLAKTDGASKYIEQPLNSSDSARAVVYFRATTKRKEIVIDKLTETNQRINSGTHVVTAIEYGAEAFFVFDCAITPTEKLEDVQQKLIKIIRSISLYGPDANVHYTIEDRIQCTFYGDFQPSINPTTFHDAAAVCNQLDGMFMSTSTNDIPIRVWLSPLSKFNENTFVKEVSISSEIERMLEKFVNNICIIEAESAKVATSLELFPRIQAIIMTFKQLISEYNAKNKKKICSIVPLIRKGTANERELQQHFAENDASPFSLESLMEWLQHRKEEDTILAQYITSLTKSGKLYNLHYSLVTFT